MASRYWVGGTAAWSVFSSSLWSATSGGAGGAGYPTSADDVFFDAASGAVTVTIGANSSCKSITTTGFTGTLTFGTVADLTVANDVLIGTGTTITNQTGHNLYLTDPGTLTSNGKFLDINIISTMSATGTRTISGNLSCNSFDHTGGSSKHFSATGTLTCYAASFNGAGTGNVTIGTLQIGGSGPTWVGTPLVSLTNIGTLAITNLYLTASANTSRLWYFQNNATSGITNLEFQNPVGSSFGAVIIVGNSFNTSIIATNITIADNSFLFEFKNPGSVVWSTSLTGGNGSIFTGNGTFTPPAGSFYLKKCTFNTISASGAGAIVGLASIAGTKGTPALPVFPPLRTLTKWA